MIGVDSNVLLRIFTDDDRAQARTAANFLSQRRTAGEHCFVSIVVLCETVWTLARGYRRSRPEIAQMVESLLFTAPFRLEEPDLALIGIKALREGFDFADAIIGERNRRAGCDYTVTFDRTAAELPNMRALR